jgi:aryl-alcohol dehydrogenase-like predicted oxidoreductase
MLKRPLGSTGLEVSALGLGCNNFGGRIGAAQTRAVVDAAFAAGITFIDTADVYGDRGGSETLLGETLGNRRKDIILATKFGLPMDEAGGLKGGSRAYVMSAVEASLKRLKTDRIDLYYFHRPDPATPIEETLRALDDLVRQGKVRFVGCSNQSAVQLDAAMEIARANHLNAFAAAQDHYNLLAREIEGALIPAIERHRLALVPYFPLASGLLSGKYRKGRPMPAGARLSDPHQAGRYASQEDFEQNLETVEQLTAFCASRGRGLLELAFAWLLAKPGVASVIAGATSPEQVRQNAGALGWQLTAAEIAEVDRITA